jgi:hypothetical protein
MVEPLSSMARPANRRSARGDIDVGVHGRDRMPAVDGVQQGQLVRMLLQHPGQLGDKRAPLEGGYPAPCPRGWLGRRHGRVHVGLVPVRDGRDDLLGHRALVGEDLPGPGRHQLPADGQQPVTVENG